jgi:thioredoxin-related protein
MDKVTYTDTSVINYINKNYYAIKLDAETKDTFQVMVQDPKGNKELKKFVFKPEMKANELAITLLNGQMGYPTTVFLDERLGMIQPIPGFIDAQKMRKVLIYYGENHYRNGVKFEDFEKSNK